MLPSELILNPDGSIYHLGLQSDQVGDLIITVGDPSRVDQVSRHFDKIVIRKVNREFVTHAGYIKDKRITVISTGIGTDNIDIVLNELDALVNFDLNSGVLKDEAKTLDIIRIGTSGAIREDIPVDSYVASRMAVGFDALQPFYQYPKNETESRLYTQVQGKLDQEKIDLTFNICSASLSIKLPEVELIDGITITAPGFYAPQCRRLRLEPRFPHLMASLANAEFENLRFTNLEMETAGIYTLSRLLGHRAISLNAILANRAQGTFSSDPNRTINTLIEAVIASLRI